MRRAALLVLAVALLLGGDRFASGYASSRTEDAIGDYLAGVADVEVGIDSFPFLGRLGASGSVSRLDVRLTDVLGQAVNLAAVRFDARGVELDRGALLDGDVYVTGVREVRVAARITEAEVRRLTRADVALEDGRATVTVAGARLGADVSVVDGTIRLAVAALDLRVPLPDTGFLPCRADARVVDGALLAQCVADELPSFVAGAVTRRR